MPRLTCTSTQNCEPACEIKGCEVNFLFSVVKEIKYSAPATVPVEISRNLRLYKQKHEVLTELESLLPLKTVSQTALFQDVLGLICGVEHVQCGTVEDN